MTQVLSHPVHANYMDRPFGFEFFAENNRDEPAPPPEPPVPGRPLLNEDETNINNQLFGNLEDPRLLENLHQFHNDPVQNLFGASTSFGHPDLNIQHALNLFSQGFQVEPLSAPAQTMNFPHHAHNFNFEPTSQPQVIPQMPQHQRAQSNSFAKPISNPQSQNPRRSHDHQRQAPGDLLRRASSSYLPTRVGSDLYNSAAKSMLKQGRDARPDSYMERRMTFTYGSDTGFKGDAYNPPKHVLSHTQNLEANKVQVVHNGYKNPVVGRPITSDTHDEVPLSARSAAVESIRDDFEYEQDGARKRKRTEAIEYDSEDDLNRLGFTKSRSRPKLDSPAPNTPRTPTADRPSSSSGAAARKASDAKQSRINLTEDEKKMNHIRSEQKRRNQIKDGFADLMHLMPDAAAAGPSKCTILAKAVEWVSDLIEGNNKLREQLTALNGGIQSSA